MAIVRRYHRYTGELWDELDLESLVDELSDFFLQSGFGEEGGEWDEDALQALHDAILDAMLRKGLLSPEDLERVMADKDALDELLQKTVERLMREGYLRASEAEPFHDPTGGGGRAGPDRPCASSSPRRPSTSSATVRCATCSARWASRRSGATTRATSRPASRPPGPRRPGSSATP